MDTRTLTESAAVVTGVSAAASTTVGIVRIARGDVRGAPGMSRAFSRIGKLANGGMMTGLAIAAGTGALVGIAAYRGARSLGPAR